MFESFIQPIQLILNQQGITKNIKLFVPPSPDLGDFCFVVNQVAGKKNPNEIAELLTPQMIKINGISEVNIFTKDGKTPIIYINFKISDNIMEKIQSHRVEDTILKVFDEDYGYLSINVNKTAIVEHTSANPISPLHVGNLRNSIQGDTFARILQRSGFTVFKHFYVNDVGLQIAFVVVGYEFAKNNNLRPPIKIDLWIGQIYAMMNCFYSIQKIKKEGFKHGLNIKSDYQLSERDIKILSLDFKNRIDVVNKQIFDLEKIDKLDKTQRNKLRNLKKEEKNLENKLNDVKKYNSTFYELKERFSSLFEVLYSNVQEINLQITAAEYLKKYEKNSDPVITNLFREVVLWVLSAFKWTLKRYNVEFDKFDFESDITWSGLPDEIIDQLTQSKLTIKSEEAIRLTYPSNEIKKLANEIGLSKSDLPIKGHIPDLQLRRSDGTALYAAKDIAYSISKFKNRNPDIIYNVISTEQILPQFQLLLPLLELGLNNYASNLKHYSYEVVELLGRTMSGRLAKYITADDFFDETYIRARMAKRQSDKEKNNVLPSNKDSWQVEHEILTGVTLASTRYPLIETDPRKKIQLDLDRELDFRRNAGPFVQYAHARCNSLINKVLDEKGLTPNIIVEFRHLTSHDIMKMINLLYDIDNKILLAIEKRDPSQIAIWCFKLAQMFMKFYEKYPVLKEDDDEIANARLTMVYLVKRGLATGLEILGIPPISKL